MTYIIREYTAADENSWLRCRVLSFLGTAYFDAVERVKPTIPAPGFELVAVDGRNTVVGAMDVAIEGELATIETVAVHPDHQRRGIGRRLLAEASARACTVPAKMLDAWTRDDPDTLRWYRAMGFTESEHDLHVYANFYTDREEPERAVSSPRAGLRPIMLFLHAKLAEERQMRNEFARVHVCRRFAKTL